MTETDNGFRSRAVTAEEDALHEEMFARIKGGKKVGREPSIFDVLTNITAKKGKGHVAVIYASTRELVEDWCDVVRDGPVVNGARRVQLDPKDPNGGVATQCRVGSKTRTTFERPDGPVFSVVSTPKQTIVRRLRKKVSPL